ncbi:MAG: choice-of-anchor tandem repeat GloVer-containing protein, partial [Verrucomicrobiota bacterium]
MRVSYHRLANSFIALAAIWLTTMQTSVAADLVTFEAESGTLGTNFTTGNASGVIYISCTNNNTSLTVPALPGRVASYSVTFPAAGTYDLYARIRVSAGAANDDSLFYGNGFGAKSSTTAADWILCNNLANVGFVNAGDIVTGGGTAASGVWKWIDISQFNGGAAPINFTVTAGNLTQTFQIGGREDGLDFDKFAFGTTGTSLAVSNLDSGTVPSTSPPLTNVFVGPDGIALHRFSPLNSGLNADGANPAAGLAVVNGILCGTTLNGGASGAGTAFYLSANGSNFVAFRAFTNAPDAGSPAGELSVSGNGFFGTSIGGGSGGVGAVFAGQTNGSVSVLRNFTTVSADNATNSGGASPTALLALSGATLYGTTTAGGAAANGTIFALTTNGATFSVLRNFSALD